VSRPAGRRRFLRWAGAFGAALAGWVAIDAFLSSVNPAAAPGGLEFFLFWGLPFAALSAGLAWYAARGGRQASGRVAKAGCLGAGVAGGSVFMAALTVGTLKSSDLLTGSVEGLKYAPLAAAVGLGVGMARARMRARRSRRAPRRE
jgi:hypothetical protein